LIFIVLSHTSSLLAAVVYSNSFNGPVGTTYSEWSSSAITYSNNIAPPGCGALPAPRVTNVRSPNHAQTFLGLFGGPAIGAPGDLGWQKTRVQQTIGLSLSNLQAHTTLQLEFDLYIINSWDGDSPAYGPDRFILSVADGPVLLDTTFSNNPKTNKDGSYQNYPVVGSAPWSGALQAGTLGYQVFFKDAIYRLQYKFPHTNANLTIHFTSSLFEGKGTNDEAWGLDNVILRTVDGTTP
jgi:hypothetical protein